MRRWIKLPSPSANGAAGLQELIMEIGLEYYNLVGVRTAGAAVAETDFTNMQPMVNNKPIWDNIDGDDFDAINQVDGLAAFGAADIMVVPFELMRFIDGVPRMAGTINTGVRSKKTGKIITNFSFKYTIATATSMDWWAEVEDSDTDGPGYIQKLSKKSVNALAASLVEIDNLPYGEDDKLNAQWRRLFFKMATGGSTISTVQLKHSDRFLVDTGFPKTINDRMLANEGKAAGAYFHYVLDLTLHNMPDYLTVLGMQKSTLKVGFTGSASEACEIITNTFGEIPG